MKRSQIKIGGLYQPTTACKLHIWNTQPSWFTEDISDNSEIIGVIDDGNHFIALDLLPPTGNKKYIDIKVLSQEGITGWVSTDICFIKEA